jgi:hypothetical protein
MGAPPNHTNGKPAAEVASELSSAGLGFDRVELLPGTTYQDNSTVIVIPTRGMMHHRFVASLQGLMPAMNQKRACFFAAGDEVGKAYDRMISTILAHPELRTWKYIMTIEDDNLVPPDAHIRLLESIEFGPKFDAVSGLYWTKGDVNMPMAYGDPDEYARTGVMEFRPRDVREAVKKAQLVQVNGIAMGCGLWRMELFKELEPPWFVTCSDVVPEKGPISMTQDLYFCKNARAIGKRFAVDCRVKVGHMDLDSGMVY